MDLYVYDYTMKLIGIAEQYQSIRWIRRYFAAGAFEIVAPSTDINLKILREKKLVLRTDRPELGVITACNIEDNADGESMITVTGFFAVGMLERRIMYDVSDTSTFLAIISRNIAQDCTDVTRRIPNLIVDKSFDLGSEYIANMRYKSLAEYAEAICRYNNCGLVCTMEHSRNNNALRLYCYKGKDRSINQHDNPQCIFSDEYGTLQHSSRNYSEAGASETIYAYEVNPYYTDGAGEQAQYCINNDSAGFDRRESAIGVEATIYKISYEDFGGYDINGQPIWETKTYNVYDYAQTIENMKVETENAVVLPADNITGDIVSDAGYMTQWDLGDIVTTYNKKWNVTLNQRITEITEYIDRSSHTIETVLGSPRNYISEFLEKGKNK